MALVRAHRVLTAAAFGPAARPGRSSRTTTDLDVGVLLPTAVESSGTSGLVSG